MQLLLPMFPKEAKLISNTLGVYEHDGLVQYIVNGLPVYCHSKEDHQAFRFITSNFIHQGLCRKVDVERAFGVSEDTVGRAYKKFIDKGESGFSGMMPAKEQPTRSQENAGRGYNPSLIKDKATIA